MKEAIINHSNNLNELETLIYKELQNIAKECIDSPKGSEKRINTWLTKSIKERVGLIGTMKNFKVASSLHNKEKLFDLTFYSIDEQDIITQLELVLESELSVRNIWGIKEDFEKLLLTNSKHRIMVCFGEGNFNHPKNINSRVQLFDNIFFKYENLEKYSRATAFIFDDYYSGKIFPHLMIK